MSSVNNPNYVTYTASPLNFVDNVEINEINFISGTKYAYYKISSPDNGNTYYGLIDVVANKVIYNFNFNEDLISFKPISSSEMLAITSTSAYKLCIIKSVDSCTDSCSSGDLVPYSDGNKCQSESDCDPGKVKLIPDNICINKDSCEEYYTLNNEETECGLCSYFYPYGNKYKLIGKTGCLGSSPNNADYYNEALFLFKCKTDYHLNGENECVPDSISCYERCDTCSEASSDINDQKCTSCISGYGYILDNGNCVLPPPTTVIIPPTTEITPPTTTIIPPTTEIIPPTTITTPKTTEISPPTTTIIPPTTEITPATTITTPKTTIITGAPMITRTEEEILETCKNEKCLTYNEESDRDGLCLSCDETIYKKVNYTNKYSKYFNCFKKEDLEFKYYEDIITGQYKPCFQLCKKCLGPGNATHHNCLECINNYMFRPGNNPYNNCVVYSEYYYRSIYNEYKILDSPFCPEEAKYMIKDENNKTSCIFDCKADNTYKYLYSGYCLKQCPDNTQILNDSIYLCLEDLNELYISENELPSNYNFTIKNIEIYAETYALEFNFLKMILLNFYYIKILI